MHSRYFRQLANVHSTFGIVLSDFRHWRMSNWRKSYWRSSETPPRPTDTGERFHRAEGPSCVDCTRWCVCDRRAPFVGRRRGWPEPRLPLRWWRRSQTNSAKCRLVPRQYQSSRLCHRTERPTSTYACKSVRWQQESCKTTVPKWDKQSTAERDKTISSNSRQHQGDHRERSRDDVRWTSIPSEKRPSQTKRNLRTPTACNTRRSLASRCRPIERRPSSGVCSQRFERS